MCLYFQDRLNVVYYDLKVKMFSECSQNALLVPSCFGKCCAGFRKTGVKACKSDKNPYTCQDVSYFKLALSLLLNGLM